MNDLGIPQIVAANTADRFLSNLAQKQRIIDTNGHNRCATVGFKGFRRSNGALQDGKDGKEIKALDTAEGADHDEDYFVDCETDYFEDCDGFVLVDGKVRILKADRRV